jgi:Icc-related predicted phosphoesterase
VLVVSDVHFALDALRRVVGSGEELLILGDLVNLTDYRTGEGAIADVLGLAFARRSADSRAVGDFDGMRALWEEAAREGADRLRADIGAAVAAQYEMVSAAMEGGSGFVIHGNVDRPDLLQTSLPSTFRYVHGERMKIGDTWFGFVGGGLETPIHAAGETTEVEMGRILDELGPVDVLCSHVPPAVDALRTDVVTGRAERGSAPLLDYLRAHQPKLHLFGDVHQPQASSWRVGATLCRNVGYFRATGRALRVDPARFA